MISGDLMDYQLADKGEVLCSDMGLDIVDDLVECRNQVGFIQNLLQKPEVETHIIVKNDMTYPKGCFVRRSYTDPYYLVFFNLHISGSRHLAARPLCRNPG